MLTRSRSAGKQTVHGERDRVGVHTVVTVEIASRAGLADVIHAERDLRHAERAAQEGQAVGMAVEQASRIVQALGGLTWGNHRRLPGPYQAGVAGSIPAPPTTIRLRAHGSELLPLARASRPDQPHPPTQEPPTSRTFTAIWLVPMLTIRQTALSLPSTLSSGEAGPTAEVGPGRNIVTALALRSRPLASMLAGCRARGR